jgi:ankyrin repeat protein
MPVQLDVTAPDPEDLPAIVNLFLTNGATVTDIDRNGMTPLLTVCSSSNADASVVKVLLAHGADFKTPDRWGHTPLHLVITQRDTLVQSLNDPRNKSQFASNLLPNDPSSAPNKRKRIADLGKVIDLLRAAGAPE